MIKTIMIDSTNYLDPMEYGVYDDAEVASAAVNCILNHFDLHNKFVSLDFNIRNLLLTKALAMVKNNELIYRTQSDTIAGLTTCNVSANFENFDFNYIVPFAPFLDFEASKYAHITAKIEIGKFNSLLDKYENKKGRNVITFYIPFKSYTILEDSKNSIVKYCINSCEFARYMHLETYKNFIEAIKYFNLVPLVYTEMLVFNSPAMDELIKYAFDIINKILANKEIKENEHA